MYCTKCGRKGFPVRLACLKCNATLAGLPGFDLPKVRAQGGKPVVCGKCGALATDARIACLGCDQSFPRPFCLEEEGYDPEFENSPAIAYYRIHSFEDACDACREMNGVCFTREHFPEYRMPIKGCKNAICWCGVIGIYADEGAYIFYEPDGSERAGGSRPAVEFAEVLRRFGGISTDPRAVAYFEAQAAARQLERERWEHERAASQKLGEALAHEKEGHAEEAISLYRESVQLYKGVAEKYSVGLNWGDLHLVYDRLTLVLERSGRPEEALAEIAQYRAMARESQQPSDSWNAFLKREARLKKQLAHQDAKREAGAESC